jgi:hypothetical protein
VVADQPAGEADQDRRRRSSATVATSPSRWPRSRCRGRCSRKSCRSSPGCGRPQRPRDRRSDQMRHTATAEVRLGGSKATSSSAARWATRRFGCEQRRLRPNFIAAEPLGTENKSNAPRIRGMSVEIPQQQGPVLL